jgi:hypothetical protein
MESFKTSVLLRVFIGEADKENNDLLFEQIVFKAKESGLAGATVLHGIMSYGNSQRIHSVKLFDIATNLPVVIEIVDDKEKIDIFLPILESLIDNAACGGMITLEKVQAQKFESKSK